MNFEIREYFGEYSDTTRYSIFLDDQEVWEKEYKDNKLPKPKEIFMDFIKDVGYGDGVLSRGIVKVLMEREE